MEHRKHQRYQFHCEIWFPGKEKSVAGTVSDLSMGGCKVGSPTPVDTGTHLELRIHFTPESKFPMKVDLAKVIWAMERAFGLEFIRMQPEEQARLRSFVTALETGPSH